MRHVWALMGIPRTGFRYQGGETIAGCANGYWDWREKPRLQS
jgi:hypothetical protein